PQLSSSIFHLFILHLASGVGIACLCDAQLFLDLLKRYALRFRNHGPHPNELQNHHAGEEREDVAGREVGDHSREEGCKQGGEYPMREAAEGLTLGAMTIGK